MKKSKGKGKVKVSAEVKALAEAAAQNKLPMVARGHVERVQYINLHAKAMQSLFSELFALSGVDVDARWLSIARARFQEGFMALRKAVHPGEEDNF